MAKEFCRNRTYETKLISHLPHEFRFADGSKSLVVYYATTDQLGHCRKIIDEAALRGDNVGVDEYENGSKAIEMLFDMSEIFQAFDPVSGAIEAFMFIQQCLYQRTYDSCTASVYVFRTKDINDEVYAELMDLAADFAKAIDIGYSQCFTQVALCLQGIYLQLRRRGFLTVAVFPNWIDIAGGSLRDNAIMVKDFGLPERPIRSAEEVGRMLERNLTPEMLLEGYTNAQIPQIPGLPKYVSIENGSKLVFRNARKDEDKLLYEMFSDAEKKGDGYSLHEFPSLNNFRLDILASSYTVVIEEEKTKELIGCLMWQDADWVRSGKQKIGEESILIRAGVRRNGFGQLLVLISQFVQTTLGYERVMRDVVHSNNRAFMMLANIPDSCYYGVLPRSSFRKGVGWVDVIIHVQEVPKKPNACLADSVNASSPRAKL